MRIQWLFLALAVILLAPALKADTYQIYQLGQIGSGVTFILGITDTGQVATRNGLYYDYTQMRCTIGDTCFSTYTPGVGSVSSANPPNLNYDNGYSCGGVSSGPESCNGERVAFTQVSASRHGAFLFEETGTDIDFIFSGQEIAQLQINKYGDIAFADYTTRVDNLYEAVDLTTRITPEPSSFALLGTGLAGAVAALRRRK